MHVYDYSFPPELIAHAPARPRDSAKLFVYDQASHAITHDTFRHLARHIPDNALIIFNETKVIPARLTVRKPTGGAVRILYLNPSTSSQPSQSSGGQAGQAKGTLMRVLADRPLAPDMILTLTSRITFRVIRRDDTTWLLRPSFPLTRLQTILQKYGTAPLPPYIKNRTLTEKQIQREYQTIFAKQRGSVAAPTASLHFTKRLLTDLKKRGVEIRFVTLHVGLGTFAPVTDEQIRMKKLHEEYYTIPRNSVYAIERAKKQGRPIIAVGTTVARTLETFARTKKTNGATDLFIQEGYAWQIVKGLITNFHVPRSSLMMLVSAFAGQKKILELYREAIRKKYRLFSFGDGMLLL